MCRRHDGHWRYSIERTTDSNDSVEMIKETNYSMMLLLMQHNDQEAHLAFFGSNRQDLEL